VYQNATLCLNYTCSDRVFDVLPPPPRTFPLLFPSYCGVAQARIYSATTVNTCSILSLDDQIWDRKPQNISWIQGQLKYRPIKFLFPIPINNAALITLHSVRNIFTYQAGVQLNFNLVTLVSGPPVQLLPGRGSIEF
jgi:hypothetical protein